MARVGLQRQRKKKISFFELYRPLVFKTQFRKTDLLPSSGVETNLSGMPLTSASWLLSSSFYGTRAVRRMKRETKPASETFNYISTTDKVRKKRRLFRNTTLQIPIYN